MPEGKEEQTVEDGGVGGGEASASPHISSNISHSLRDEYKFISHGPHSMLARDYLAKNEFGRYIIKWRQDCYIFFTDLLLVMLSVTSMDKIEKILCWIIVGT